MKHTLIRNAGLAPLESFTILGLSTARGQADTIGQFGSGAKHGLLTLMRANIAVRVFIGTDELVLTTHPQQMNGKPYDEVRFTFKGETHRTGTCLDFGALDWTHTDMAMREFICNALDQGESIASCVVEHADIEPHPSETRIYVESAKPIRDYVENLSSFFLHVTGKQRTTLIPNNSTELRLYRRGVFVRTTEPAHRPLFHYNMWNGRIDEARNLDSASMSAIVGKLLPHDVAALTKVFTAFTGERVFEHDCGWGADNNETVDNIAEAWKLAHGDKPYVVDEEQHNRLAKKGIKSVIVTYSWQDSLRTAGIVYGAMLLTRADNRDYDVLPATPDCIATFQRVWSWLEGINATSGKVFPQVGCFASHTNAGENAMGLYDNGVCYLNIDEDTSEQTALEELAHYITGSTDNSRDFQEFAFRCALRFAKRGNVFAALGKNN